MLHHYHVRSASSSTTVNAGNKITGKPSTRGRAATVLPEDLAVAASLKQRTLKAKKAKALKKHEEKEEEEFFQHLHKDDGMASSFLQYCTMCDSEIRVPDNSVLYCSESCRRKDSLPTSPSTTSVNLSLHYKRPELNRIVSVLHTGNSDPDPTEWKPSDPSDASEWKPPKSAGQGKYSDPDMKNNKDASGVDRLSKTTGNHWKPKLPQRGSSDAYKYLSGFHKETPKLGSARSSANTSRTSLTSLNAAMKPAAATGKDINAMINAVNAIGDYNKQGPTYTTTRSAPSLSHTPITSTDDEDSSLASTPESGSAGKYVPLRGVNTGSMAVSSASASSSASSVEKDLHMPTGPINPTATATTKKGMKMATEPPTPGLPMKSSNSGVGITTGGITKLRAASSQGDVARNGRGGKH